MRIARYEKDGNERVGLRVDGGLVELDVASPLELIQGGAPALERALKAAADGEPCQPDRLLAPLPNPPKILASGVNFAAHRDEVSGPPPERPFLFSKLPSTMIGPEDEIRIPQDGLGVDYEVELAVVIGKTAHRTSAADALEHVFGYTVVNDVSARAIQLKDEQITIGKNLDTFCPMGPEIVLPDELPDPQDDLKLETRVNGELRQSDSTANMIFSVAALIETISELITLYPGDVIATGTPSGAGAFMDPPVYLEPGDTVTVSVERVGTLTNPVVSG